MKVLTISVHPDDETLGCGGSILKHKLNGDEVYCIYITNGNEFQAKAIQTINKMFNFDKSYQLGFPETTLDDISLNDIIPKLTTVINEIKPEVVYMPNRSDVHSDHRRTFEALMAVTKTFRYPYITKILMCEVISESDFAPALAENAFQPNVFVDISDFMAKKLEIMNVFESELLESPNTRSIDSITAYNRYRGSQINCMYAEAFMLLKEII
jgi:N-acetylglucosamine malate deacetylase 1